MRVQLVAITCLRACALCSCTDSFAAVCTGRYYLRHKGSKAEVEDYLTSMGCFMPASVPLDWPSSLYKFFQYYANTAVLCIHNVLAVGECTDITLFAGCTRLTTVKSVFTCSVYKTRAVLSANKIDSPCPLRQCSQGLTNSRRRTFMSATYLSFYPSF